MMIIPVDQLNKSEIRDLHKVAHQVCANQQVKDVGGDVVVRELVVGDESNAADFVDLGVKTAVASGQQFWAQDANDLTNYTLSSVLASGETIPDNKTVVFYGIYDNTANPDCTGVRFKKGTSTLFYSNVTHLYAYDNPVGFFVEMDETGEVYGVQLLYKNNDKIDLQLRFKDGSVDKEVGFYALIAERPAEVVNKAVGGVIY